MTQTPSKSVFEPMLLESEDAVLKAADEIRLKRLNRARWSSFQEKKEVMILWDNPGNKFGESYTSVTVPAEEVAGIVISYLGPR